MDLFVKLWYVFKSTAEILFFLSFNNKGYLYIITIFCWYDKSILLPGVNYNIFILMSILIFSLYYIYIFYTSTFTKDPIILSRVMKDVKTSQLPTVMNISQGPVLPVDQS